MFLWYLGNNLIGAPFVETLFILFWWLLLFLPSRRGGIVKCFSHMSADNKTLPKPLSYMCVHLNVKRSRQNMWPGKRKPPLTLYRLTEQNRLHLFSNRLTDHLKAFKRFSHPFRKVLCPFNGLNKLFKHLPHPFKKYKTRLTF